MGRGRAYNQAIDLHLSDDLTPILIVVPISSLPHVGWVKQPNDLRFPAAMGIRWFIPSIVTAAIESLNDRGLAGDCGRRRFFSIGAAYEADKQRALQPQIGHK